MSTAAVQENTGATGCQYAEAHFWASAVSTGSFKTPQKMLNTIILNIPVESGNITSRSLH